MNLPIPANANAATVTVLEFLCTGQDLIQQTNTYFEQVRAGQFPRRLVKKFYREAAPKVIRHARDFARIPEIATFHEPLLTLATNLEKLRTEARRLM